MDISVCLIFSLTFIFTIIYVLNDHMSISPFSARKWLNININTFGFLLHCTSIQINFGFVVLNVYIIFQATQSHLEVPDQLLVMLLIIILEFYLSLIAPMVGKSFTHPLNYKLIYDSSLTVDMEDIELLKSSLWERDHPEMEIHEAYTKSTQFTGTDYNVTVNETFNHNVESWSLILYLICFLVLIMFFLMISVLEVCCKRSLLSVPAPQESQAIEVAPPPYDLFGPPTYDSLYETKFEKKKKYKGKCSVFVVHLPKRRSTFELQENRSTQVPDDISPPPPP